jgi:hypothetical protein
MSGDGEERLPVYGLPNDWPGERRLGAHGADVWEGHHAFENDDVIVVHVQRRAIHGALPRGSRRIIGPEHLIRFDAALDAMLSAHGSELAAVRSSSGTAAMKLRVRDLDEAARRIGHDAASWQPSELTIDGSRVEAIEITHDGWWLVLHIGIGEVADVYVYGPPASRPTPLTLQSVSEAAYQ